MQNNKNKGKSTLFKGNKYAAMLAVLFLPRLVFAASSSNSLETFVNNIVEFSQNGIVKSVCVLIIMGIAIYMIKNHDRLKEVAVMCITIILGIVIFMNAESVASALFS